MKTQTLNVTLLAAGATIHGDLILDHGLSSFGIVDGNLISNAGLLHVGLGGMVKGTVQGEHVRIDGSVEGDIRARATLEINGRVKGNIFYCGTIRLGPRAAIDGQLKRVSRELTIDAPAADGDAKLQSPVHGKEKAAPADVPPSNVQHLPLSAANN
ncbi:bactofilin family protein [Paraburkholderia rhizosphaerae]|uniref:Polymer-forming protein n=1 Tax=Paraburkholderia rhizosphaerae TaxID=480658 RepID=A0A4R8LP61_9BURK|nr:polymer-forming cytoskeletal protein [Paraburkholderia rhizosphaerae]TDY48088.1 polymer-forming protein [Paraburkholderia rhizosphaerae]